MRSLIGIFGFWLVIAMDAVGVRLFPDKMLILMIALIAIEIVFYSIK